MGSVCFGCGCSVSSEMGTGKVLSVVPCSRHRRHEDVAAALEALAQAQLSLRKALSTAHADLSPMQIEQEERSGEDRRAS